MTLKRLPFNPNHNIENNLREKIKFYDLKSFMYLKQVYVKLTA